MVISTKYLVRINAQADFYFNSVLEMKEFLGHINSAVASTPIRVYKVVFTLDTSTHYVSKVETELTAW